MTYVKTISDTPEANLTYKKTLQIVPHLKSKSRVSGKHIFRTASRFVCGAFIALGLVSIAEDVRKQSSEKHEEWTMGVCVRLGGGGSTDSTAAALSKLPAKSQRDPTSSLPPFQEPAEHEVSKLKAVFDGGQK